MATVSSSSLESVSGTEDVTGKAQLVGAANMVQISLVLGQYSNNTTGSVDAVLQQGNDGQNWVSVATISAAFAKAGTVQVGQFSLSAKYYRIVMKSTPNDNTVSYALETSLSQQ